MTKIKILHFKKVKISLFESHYIYIYTHIHATSPSEYCWQKFGLQHVAIKGAIEVDIYLLAWTKFVEARPQRYKEARKVGIEDRSPDSTNINCLPHY